MHHSLSYPKRLLEMFPEPSPGRALSLFHLRALRRLMQNRTMSQSISRIRWSNGSDGATMTVLLRLADDGKGASLGRQPLAATTKEVARPSAFTSAPSFVFSFVVILSKVNIAAVTTILILHVGNGGSEHA